MVGSLLQASASGSQEVVIMIVTNRDLSILQICLEQKFLTLVQIGEMFFPQSVDSLKVPLRRVNMLMKAGLLRAVKPRVCHKTLYMTTQEGARLLKTKNCSEGLRALVDIDLKTFEHDMQVTDVRVVFHRVLGFRYWIPERVLKKQNLKAKVPDGIAGTDEESYVIEVERTLKNKRYYKRAFLDMDIAYRSHNGILYVTDNVSDMNWLKKQAERYRTIYFQTVDQVLNAPFGVNFENVSGGFVFLEHNYGCKCPQWEPPEDFEDLER